MFFRAPSMKGDKESRKLTVSQILLIPKRRLGLMPVALGSLIRMMLLV